MLRKEASMYQASQKWLSMYSQVGYWSEGPSTYGIALWLRLLKENEKQQEADICALPLYFLHFKLISLAVCERRYYECTLVYMHTEVRRRQSPLPPFLSLRGRISSWAWGMAAVSAYLDWNLAIPNVLPVSITPQNWSYQCAWDTCLGSWCWDLISNPPIMQWVYTEPSLQPHPTIVFF